ncbi:MAG: hypothetical protein O3C21_15225 [Verrucomicrobia bacterium]|nr:hypothetical protein [Verrucomicrobiota bacterium]
MSASRRPNARFPVEWRKKLAADMPHLTVFAVFSEVLQLEALASLRIGDPSAAFERVLAIPRLAKLALDDPSLMNLLASENCCRAVMQPVWEGIYDRVWVDEQLREIENVFSQIDFLESAPRVLRFERAMVCSTLINQDSSQLSSMSKRGLAGWRGMCVWHREDGGIGMQ